MLFIAITASFILRAAATLVAPLDRNSSLPTALDGSPVPAYEEISRLTLLADFCFVRRGRRQRHRSPTEPRWAQKCAMHGDGSEAVCKDKSVRDAVCSAYEPAGAARYSVLTHAEVRAADSACARCREAADACRFYSQQGEDRVVYDTFFRGQRGRDYVYLELGALDGVLYSNSLFFEKTLDWSGVLVEGSLGSFERLRENRKAAHNHIVHAAVCADPAREVAWQGGDAMAGIVARSRRRLMNCTRMDSILEEASVTYLDFWSLDVEGGELDVLMSLDLSKVPVRVLVIERNANDLAIERLLRGYGFTYFREQAGNRIWVNENFEAQRLALPKARARPVVDC